MRALCFGDIMGRPGRTALTKICQKWKKEYAPHVTIANGENLAHGKGISLRTIQELFDCGIDVITSGNHVFEHRDARLILKDETLPVLRPHNFHPDLPGKGWHIFSKRGKKVGVINLSGRLFMPQFVDDPFRMADTLLSSRLHLKKRSGGGVSCDAIIVDWHAEATSEKVAMGLYLDGRVSAVLGTHTHIPTADARILPRGTAFISDIGMTGVRDSILGMHPEKALDKLRMQIPSAMEIADGDVEINAALIDIKADGSAQNIEPRKEVMHI